MIIIISILAALLITSGFIIYNLLRKVEGLESYTEELEASNASYDEFFTVLKQRVNGMYSHIKNIDRLGSFQADDETGTIFNEIKSVIEKLNEGF
jgi:hypothetical protein